MKPKMSVRTYLAASLLALSLIETAGAKTGDWRANYLLAVAYRYPCVGRVGIMNSSYSIQGARK